MSMEFVEWELTRDCNLSCRHCRIREKGRRPEELDPDEALDLVDRLVAFGCRSITLSGGEPLLRSDWSAIAGRLRDLGVSVQLVSNGSLMDREQARLAAEAGLNMVFLSLDGMRIAHDRIRRRPGSFHEVSAACDELRSADVPFGFITTILASNLDQPEPMADLVNGCGASIWQVWMGMPRNPSDRSSRMWLGRRDIGPLRERLYRLRHRCPALVPGDNLRDEHVCLAGRRVFGIGSDGSVRGCLSLPEKYNAGSVREHTLETVSEAASKMLAGSDRSCRATLLEPRNVSRRATGGAAAAVLLMATSFSGGCSSHPVERTVAQEDSSSPVVYPEPIATTDPLGIDARMPPCCISHMLIPDCVCSWKIVRIDGLNMNLQVPLNSELKEIPGSGVEINTLTDQTARTPSRLTIRKEMRDGLPGGQPPITLSNGATLVSIGPLPETGSSTKPREITRKGILALGDEHFEVECWTKSGWVMGIPPVWPNWCLFSLGTLKKIDRGE